MGICVVDFTMLRQLGRSNEGVVPDIGPMQCKRAGFCSARHKQSRPRTRAPARASEKLLSTRPAHAS